MNIGDTPTPPPPGSRVRAYLLIEILREAHVVITH